MGLSIQDIEALVNLCVSFIFLFFLLSVDVALEHILSRLDSIWIYVCEG